ncbi:hypothetical protein BS47DRAFT_1366509 [Hydnum rufescens UP504]|uniref:FAD-binding domain-containing protein n=1 Tax=Hydnum rufescens UP504 TaxID=1448309 RepID=A0A9P6DN88_9AGAM|nr:hypothetical protein BS47DRAFT_1366509 [Hydnum rufescens UP504]
MSSPQELIAGGLAPALVLRNNGIVVHRIGKALDYQIAPWQWNPNIVDNPIKPPQTRALAEKPTLGRGSLPNPRILGQSTIEAILRSHLSQLGVTVELGTELVDFTQDACGVTGGILKRDKSGSSQNETLEVEWVIGADGAREMGGLDHQYWAVYGSTATRLYIFLLRDDFESSGPTGWVLALPMGSAPHFSVVGNGTQEEIQEVVDVLYLASKDASQSVNPGFLHDDVFKQLGVNYQWSEIVLDQHLDSRKKVNVGNKVYMWYGNGDERIQAGDRALDAPNLVLVPAAAEPTTTARLLDLLTTFGHTVLVFELLETNCTSQLRTSCVRLENTIKMVIASSIRTLSFARMHSMRGRGEWLGMNRVFVDTQGHARKAYDVDASQARKALLSVVIDLLWCICT